MKKLRITLVAFALLAGMTEAVSQSLPATTKVSELFTEAAVDGTAVYPVFNKSTAKVINHNILMQSTDVYHDGIFTLNSNPGIGFLDAQGNILPGEYQWSLYWDSTLPVFSNGYVIVTKKKRNPFSFKGYDIESFIMDKKGVTKKITAVGEIYRVKKFNKDGIATITIKGAKGQFRTAFINTKGQPVYRNLWRDETRNMGSLGEFHDGLALFYDSYSSKYGYVNRQGQIVIKNQYEDASEFSEGLAVVMKKVGIEIKYIFINTKGQQAIPRTFSNKPKPFSCGYSVVKKTDGSYVMIDKEGNVKSPAYKAVTSFYPWGKAIAEKGCSLYIIDKSFNEISYIGENLFFAGELNMFVTEDGLIFHNNSIYDFYGNDICIRCNGNKSLIGGGLAKIEFGNSFHDKRTGFVNLKTGKLVCYFEN